jgi:Fe-S cluster biogenesis protein NfuA
MTAPDVRDTGERLERLLADLATLGEPRVSEKVEELVRLLVRLYDAGLARILDIVCGQLDDNAKFGQLLANDELVASLLVLHGLHPVGIEARVRSVIGELGAKADGVRLLGVDEDGVAHLELTPTGCGSSAATRSREIERTLADAVPDLTAVRVRETPKAKAAQQIIPMEALFRNPSAAAPR